MRACSSRPTARAVGRESFQRVDEAVRSVISLQTWALFCVTETVLCFTPGPAVLLVVSLALTRGTRAGLAASLGILAANALYFLLSATGLGAVLLASAELFFLIKWLGAAYLLWIGLRMLLARAQPLTAGDTPSRRPVAPLRHGLITQGANPKALVFFTALLPQFVDSGRAIAPQIAILGISSILIEFTVLALYVAVCQRARGVMHRPGFATALNRAGGVLLIGAGAGLATIKP
jgi:homoserine/homoserine lactone efflux protein